MKDIIRAIDNLPFIVKLILALPGLAVFWAVYRLFRSIDKQNVLGIVLAAVLLVAVFFEVADLEAGFFAPDLFAIISPRI